MADMRIFDALAELFFPFRQACPLCGEPGPKMRVCGPCSERLAGYALEPVCIKCGRFFISPPEEAGGAGELHGRFCRTCEKGSRNFDLCRSAGPYEGCLKTAVHRLKYSGCRHLAGFLAEIMLGVVATDIRYARSQAMVPVPVSRRRLGQRGFNQAELLAVSLAGMMAIPVLPVLKKVRETPPQTSLDRAGRRENLKGAFALESPGGIKGKTVLVVDDVTTTGSTLEEVSGLLAASGAREVLCLTAAAGRTGPGRRENTTKKQLPGSNI